LQGNDLSQRCLAGSGWAEKEQGLDTIRFNGAPQEHSVPQNVTLADVLIQRPGAHSSCQWSTGKL
jgi:hypothetical protein